jgi:threonine dehydratase
VKALVEEVMLVSDAEAVGGLLTLAEDAKLWAEPGAGCLIPAAQRVVQRVPKDAKLGLVVCGGNVAFADVQGWVERFGLKR